MLMNSQLFSTRLRDCSAAWQKECADDRAAQIARAWQLAFSQNSDRA